MIRSRARGGRPEGRSSRRRRSVATAVGGSLVDPIAILRSGGPGPPRSLPSRRGGRPRAAPSIAERSARRDPHPGGGQMSPRRSEPEPDAPAGPADAMSRSIRRLLGAWIDRWIDEGVPIGGNAPPRAVIAPHIDPVRGARVYGSAYRLLREHPARADRGPRGRPCRRGTPFAVTDRTDRDTVRSLPGRRRLRPGARQGSAVRSARRRALLHRDELSIAHQALFLRRALAGWDDRRIVPILCCFPWTSPTRRR